MNEYMLHITRMELKTIRDVIDIIYKASVENEELYDLCGLDEDTITEALEIVDSLLFKEGN